MGRRSLLLALAFVALAAGCGGAQNSSLDNPRADPAAQKLSCPAAWRPGWQKLADRVGTLVYCPSWVPSPLDARIGGRWSTGVSLGRKDHSYLAGFIWFEHGSGEVHINLRGYPHRTTLPLCVDEETVGAKLVRSKVPCFSDKKATKRIGPYTVTLYTVNRDADQWHLLYLWRHRGSLYTVSEHVAPPYGYQRVLSNLDRMMRNLVPVAPAH